MNGTIIYLCVGRFRVRRFAMVAAVILTVLGTFTAANAQDEIPTLRVANDKEVSVRFEISAQRPFNGKKARWFTKTIAPGKTFEIKLRSPDPFKLRTTYRHFADKKSHTHTTPSVAIKSFLKKSPGSVLKISALLGNPPGRKAIPEHRFEWLQPKSGERTPAVLDED